MLKRIKTARPAFRQAIGSLLCHGAGFSQPILKQFRLRKFISRLMLAMIGRVLRSAPASKPPRQTPTQGFPHAAGAMGSTLRNDGPIFKSIDSGTPQIRTTPQHCPSTAFLKCARCCATMQGLRLRQPSLPKS